MQLSPRPRRFRRNATRHAHALVTTLTIMIRNGIPARLAERYAGQITKHATRLGATPTATTWTKHGGRARPTHTWNLSNCGLTLLLALATYRPAAPRRLKNGQPSRAKAEQAKAARLAEYTAAIGTLALAA